MKKEWCVVTINSHTTQPYFILNTCYLYLVVYFVWRRVWGVVTETRVPPRSPHPKPLWQTPAFRPQIKLQLDASKAESLVLRATLSTHDNCRQARTQSAVVSPPARGVTLMRRFERLFVLRAAAWSFHLHCGKVTEHQGAGDLLAFSSFPLFDTTFTNKHSGVIFDGEVELK